MWLVKMDSKVYVGVFLISVFISSCSQIILKKSADKKYETKLKEILNPMVVGAYIFFFLSSLLTMFAYRGIKLSVGPMLESVGYIFIMILSRIFLKEKITAQKLVGNILIIIGIIVAVI